MRPTYRLSSVALSLCLMGPLVGLPACTAPPVVPTEMLDRDTGATVTSPAKPLLFVRMKEFATSSPYEYVTLVAVDVNQNARHESLLLAYGWDSLQVAKGANAAGTLRILADDQVLELQPETRTPRDFGIATLPHAPPKGFSGAPMVYRCEIAAWQLLASARQLIIQVGAVDPGATRYEIWTDGRPALREMLATFKP